MDISYTEHKKHNYERKINKLDYIKMKNSVCQRTPLREQNATHVLGEDIWNSLWQKTHIKHVNDRWKTPILKTGANLEQEP